MNFSCHSKIYRDVFTGTELIDWLLEVGLANERSEGVVYGRRLLEGAVIEHVTGNHHFQDMAYFYRLVKLESLEVFGSANHYVT